MADVEYWIQIENRPWDVSPNEIDRMTGLTIKELEQHEGPPGTVGNDPIDVTLTSPETGVTATRRMYKPLRIGGKVADALILRRYTEKWAAPDDRKVNPWDLNEPDPTDKGTMGTIPGPVIECQVGDRVTVHLRNKDFRADKPVLNRCHSLHPHGFVFAPTSDGAYPLSPPDPSQPVGGEAALWTAIGVTDGEKKADRVPPGGTYTYTWNTFGWPSTAGVWLYHDHAVCDMDNVQLGAIGIIVIHNPEDPDDVMNPPLPGDSFIGSPLRTRCRPFPFDVDILPQDLNRVALSARAAELAGTGDVRPVRPQPGGHPMLDAAPDAQDVPGAEPPPAEVDQDDDEEAPVLARIVQRGDLMLELDEGLTRFRRICSRTYRPPPDRGLYLQLYHDLAGGGMCINGRRYLGNTPTIVAGLDTKMRFGLVGMGGSDGFHTFHLHGHRWVIPGPDGNNPGQIQASPQVTAVSQFEDTRTFGPANSFAFTINQGSFMGALRGSEAPAVGEWHMHCHVLNHMMMGMMGSLLIVRGEEPFLGLPSGQPCEMDMSPQANTIVAQASAWSPPELAVAAGTSVTFNFQTPFHTVMTVSTSGGAVPIAIDNGGGPRDAVPASTTRSVVVDGPPGSVINYQCGIHLTSMTGTILLI